MNPFSLEMNLQWLEMNPFSLEMNLQRLEKTILRLEMNPFPLENHLQWLEKHPLPLGNVLQRRKHMPLPRSVALRRCVSFAAPRRSSWRTALRSRPFRLLRRGAVEPWSRGAVEPWSRGVHGDSVPQCVYRKRRTEGKPVFLGKAVPSFAPAWRPASRFHAPAFSGWRFARASVSSRIAAAIALIE